MSLYFQPDDFVDEENGERLSFNPIEISEFVTAEDETNHVNFMIAGTSIGIDALSPGDMQTEFEYLWRYNNKDVLSQFLKPLSDYIKIEPDIGQLPGCEFCNGNPFNITPFHSHMDAYDERVIYEEDLKDFVEVIIKNSRGTVIDHIPGTVYRKLRKRPDYRIAKDKFNNIVPTSSNKKMLGFNVTKGHFFITIGSLGYSEDKNFLLECEYVVD